MDKCLYIYTSNRIINHCLTKSRFRQAFNHGYDRAVRLETENRLPETVERVMISWSNCDCIVRIIHFCTAVNFADVVVVLHPAPAQSQSLCALRLIFFCISWIFFSLFVIFLSVVRCTNQTGKNFLLELLTRLNRFILILYLFDLILFYERKRKCDFFSWVSNLSLGNIYYIYCERDVNRQVNGCVL